MLFFSNNVQLKESLNDMRGSSIELTDIHQKVGISLENEAQTTYHSIQLYVGYLVDMRNSLAHKYHSPYPKSDPDSMKKINLSISKIYLFV